mgnify:CR=1 FL=1
MKHLFTSYIDIFFWIVAVALLALVVTTVFFAVRFLSGAVTSTFSGNAGQAPLIIHFDFAKLNQALAGKSIQLPVQ